MGSKSQKQKERHAKKRQEKKKQDRSRSQGHSASGWIAPAVGNNSAHRERIGQQIPRGWEGELPEDVAVFDDATFAVLSSELKQQVTVVRKALQDANEGRREDALSGSAVIPRSSPLSEWRLFIRGLVDWLEGNSAAASEAWQRLNLERRPGRIATAMMLALRPDLEQAARLAPSGEVENVSPETQSPASLWNQWDDQQLYHAKLLRRVRIDRAALRVADVGLKLVELPQKLLLGPKKIQWLKRFIKEYEDTEPELTAALSHAALRRAFAQPYDDLFEQAIREFPGPKHDPRNLLLSFFFYERFDDDSVAAEKGQRALDQYLDVDLPSNTLISKPLRNAIASQIHYLEAMSLINLNDPSEMRSWIFANPEDQSGIRRHFKNAQKAYGRNLAAHKSYVEWIEDHLENDRLTAAKKAAFEKELATAMRSWSEGRPEDVEPRLWLVDFLLEEEALEEAKPHVDFLAGSRQDDPRVRATPWKWQLLEAMRLCRRKAWLPEVPARLDEAEKLWPIWMPKRWLPYLRAAYTLRTGDIDAFETQRRQICDSNGLVRDSLADACMMLGAAQQMRVPAEGLKQLRLPIDLALKNIKALSLNDLVDAGGFFWDLHRAKLLYPAYRLHGGKFCQELTRRWKIDSKPILEGINDDRIIKALLWCTEFRFWFGNSITLPSFFDDKSVKEHPLFCAAKLNMLLKERHWGIGKHAKVGQILREAAKSERDAYYRFWFGQLADSLDEAIAESNTPSPFSRLFGRSGFGGPSAEADFDDDCDCADCRARRARQQ